MSELQPTGRSFLRVYQVIGVTLPALGALIGGLLARHGDQTYERETGKTLSSQTVRGDIIAGALSGFMLAVLITFFLVLVVGLARRLWRANRGR